MHQLVNKKTLILPTYIHDIHTRTHITHIKKVNLSWCKPQRPIELEDVDPIISQAPLILDLGTRRT